MSSTMTPLTQELLNVLFAQPDIARPWKNALADRILDLHAAGDAGDPLEAHAILDHLFVHAPQVLERLLENPRVKDELEWFLTPTAPAPSHELPRTRVPVTDEDAGGDVCVG